MKGFSLFELAAAGLSDGPTNRQCLEHPLASNGTRLWLISLLAGAMGEIATTLMLSEKQDTIGHMKQLGIEYYFGMEALTASVL